MPQGDFIQHERDTGTDSTTSSGNENGLPASLIRGRGMPKRLKIHEESSSRRKVDDEVHEGAIPSYLLDRAQTTRAKIISNSIKQKRKEKAGKWEVPLPK
ncbi:hypothetical protein Droror1_Dr00002177 [Drosera rotundifolia]